MAATEAVRALEAAFVRIAGTRMAGLPLNNPALRVQAVGFRAIDEHHQVGILVTPWALNLVVVGDRSSIDLRLAPDCRHSRDFPSGSYEFMGGEEAECGPYQFCSLFSPAFEFGDQDAALAMAEEIMHKLLLGAAAEADEERELARLAGRSAMQCKTSRRGFLRGVFGGLKA